MVWVIVLSFVFAECAFIIGLFLPGDSLLFTAGVVLAGGDHTLHAWALSLVAPIVAVLGNLLGYYIGRKSGRALILRRGGRVLSRERLNRAQRFLNKHGWWAIVLARWIPWIRTLAPLIAGAARMDARRYFIATTAGALLWVPGLVLAGFYGAGLLRDVPWLQDAVLYCTVGFFVAGTVLGLWRFRQEMRRPAEQVTVSSGTGQR